MNFTKFRNALHFFKSVFHFERMVGKNHNFETQIYLCFDLTKDIEIVLFQSIDNFILRTYLNILGLFEFNIEWSRKVDHAGFRFHFCFLFISFDVQLYNINHYEEDDLEDL